MLLFYLLMLFI